MQIWAEHQASDKKALPMCRYFVRHRSETLHGEQSLCLSDVARPLVVRRCSAGKKPGSITNPEYSAKKLYLEHSQEFSKSISRA